jgi:hypothetical protein
VRDDGYQWNRYLPHAHCHPSVDGYAIIAEHAARAVRQAEALLRVESTGGRDTRSVGGASSPAAVGTLWRTQRGGCPLALPPAKRMDGPPVSGDVDPPTDPHPVVALEVVEEARESGPYEPSSEAGLQGRMGKRSRTPSFVNAPTFSEGGSPSHRLGR